MVTDTRGLEDPLAAMDDANCTRQDITALLANFSIEVMRPTAKTLPDFTSLIPAGTQVYLPFLPRGTLADGVRVAERLASEGMVPVLHIAARRLKGLAELEDMLDQLRESAGLSSALVIAGDCEQVAGPYGSSLELLETGVLERHGISNFGIAGYPEGHPTIPEAVIWESLARKCAYAKTSVADFRIVSQFTFSHQSLLRWEGGLRRAGIALPVRPSVPGPAKLRTLLRFARTCGVAASLRQFTRNPKALTRLATIGTPDRLLTAIARYRAASPGSLIDGIHLNTFGGFEETACWVKAIVEGCFSMNRDNDGFRVE